uniref:J domain-containing protein n=1 Tax=Coccolithus braarudii TaxID=221442 RepID=A0A7S0L601_9EUKA
MSDVLGPAKKDREQVESEEKKKQEPLPEIPQMPMTIDAAYAFLGLEGENRGSLEKLKMCFRKMSLKWHPDKNIHRQEAAAEVFKAVNAAYHTLTTNNFDYKRWAESFVIPPMQSLEDVLLLALKGADPYQIEILLKRRGDYRPHQDFGVNLSIPWNAGSREDPSYHVHAGAAHTTTEGLEDKRRAELGYGGGGGGGGGDGYGSGAIVQHTTTEDLLETFGEKAQVGADSAARPWETVGGVGFGGAAPKKMSSAPTYQKPKGRTDLNDKSADAKTVAEEFNDLAVKAFKAKQWQLCYDHASEAIRLNPHKTAYLGNRAAAALKIKSRKMLRQAAEDSVQAYEMDPAYTKAYVRAAQAHLELGERATVKLAVQEYEKALELSPDNRTYKDALKDAQLTWEADWA